MSIARLLAAFAVAFTRPTFEHVQVLVTGTLLASGRRTVAAALRAVGLGEERHFTTYHRVLNRAVWSPLRLSRILLDLTLLVFWHMVNTVAQNFNFLEGICIGSLT